MIANENVSRIPESLKSIANWVAWRLVKKDDEDSKVPFVVGSDRHASSTDPSTWVDFETAVQNIDISSEGGIGFVIGGEAVQQQIVGFDIDGCRNPVTEEVTPWADEIIDCLDSYTEFTPSGTGVRVWVKGQLPGKDRVFNLDPDAGVGSKVKIEVFDSARYFTVTGDAYFEDALGIENRDLAKAYELCREIKRKHPPKSNSSVTDESADGSIPRGVQIQTSGFILTDKYELLMHGVIRSDKPFVIEDGYGNKLNYPSPSEADLASSLHSIRTQTRE